MITRSLTTEEMMIARLVSRGRTNAEIATALGKGIGTTRNQLRTVLLKLGLRNRAMLAAWYAAQSGNVR